MKPTADDSPAERPMPWWISPTGISLGFLLPILFLIAAIGRADFPGLVVRGHRFLNLHYLALGVLLLLVVALAGWVGQQLRLRRKPGYSPADWDVAALAVGLVAIAAYTYWFKDFLTNPNLLLRTLIGAYQPDRGNSELAVTTGITSLTNVAPAFLSVYAFRIAMPGPRVPRALHLMAGAMVALTLFRVYLWSERLAMIEATIPFALAAGAVAARSKRPLVKLVLLFGPFVAMPALVLYFGAAEYFRSWASATYNGKLDFWEFALGRMASYYFTSLNNGAGLLETVAWPTFTFEHTLFWLHRAPLSVGPMFSAWVEMHVFSPEVFLTRFADVEFNNPSGLYAVISDLGLPLGVGYFALVAFVGGLLFSAYREGLLIGALAYPMVFLSLLEVFRYPYLGQSRAFTWTLGVLLVLAVVSASRRLRAARDGFSDARSSPDRAGGSAYRPSSARRAASTPSD